MTWTTRTQPTTSWTPKDNLLLLEDGFALLQEDDSLIILEQLESTSWTERGTITTNWT